MSDVGREIVPDKGRLIRELLVTKALEFPFCTGKSFFIGTGTESVEKSVYREMEGQICRQGTVKETKGNGGYLKNILSLTGSQ